MAAGYSNIQYIGFGLNNSDDNERNSNVEITSYELFASNGQPVEGGVYDLRMGTTDHTYVCTTCAYGKKLCPGHRGHLALKTSVLQPIAISEIRRWLRIVCFKCGEILVEQEKFINEAPAKRLMVAATVSTDGKVCPRQNCKAVHPKIYKDTTDNFTFWADFQFDKKPNMRMSLGDKLYPDTIRKIFERISDDAVQYLGRSIHPRELIIQNISIPPNNIRPGVKSFGGASGSSYHDSTSLIQHLTKRNMQLPDQMPDAINIVGGKISEELDRSIQNLQQIYFDLLLGSSSSSFQNNSGKRGLVIGSRPVNSFLRNLTQKDGRIRSNLLGKRVFYISRSTISGNMSYKIDEVGIPLEFARTLQVQETVQEYNRERLMTYFLNGRRQYPGCTHIIKFSTGEVHDVSGMRDSFLEIGDIVFRDLIDGDYAFFNRAPTLERSSIGVHRAIIIQDLSVHTFQMNVLACEWYNADFDGDQMNLWVARSPAARAEAMIMSSVANWFISTKTSGPVNGEVQDSLVGCYELTRANVLIDRYHAMMLFASTGIDFPQFTEQTYTGRDIVSLLFTNFPINYKKPPSSYSDLYAPYINFDKSETMTIVEKGKMIRGVLDKRSIGAKASGGLFHLISREFGSQKALDMIFALQQIALQFLLYSGFTVGTADLLPNIEALGQIRSLVSSVELESHVITEKLLRGEIAPPIDSTIHDFYERMQINALKINESEILRWILGTIHPHNNGFFKMVATGSKGNNPNIIHVTGSIGQTLINGERMREQFALRRTSPYFPRFAIDPRAYGFVANSYMSGMSASEFTFQSMNGRFDLINKALSTASTGYFMRKGVMNNQSNIVNNLRHVVKDSKIIQFIYGEDGLDSRELEKVTYPYVFISDSELISSVGVNLKELGASGTDAELNSAQKVIDNVVKEIRRNRDEFRKTIMKFETTNFKESLATELLVPVNVKRIIEGVLIANDAEQPALVAAAMQTKIERVIDLCERLPYVLINEIQERNRSYIPPHKKTAAHLLCSLVRAELSPKVIMKLTDEQLTFIMDSIFHRYSMSLIDYGTAVGILAAQAISEPLTQYMLDSHHRSVAGGTSKSGLVRITEIYGARRVEDEQSPMMQLPLKLSALGNPEGAFNKAQEIANNIEYVTFRRFMQQYDIILEPYNNLIYPPYKKDESWIAAFEKSHPLIQPPGDLTNWCFRFILDKTQLVLKAVEVELIVRRIRTRHPNVYVVHTSEAAPQVVIRIWHRSMQFKRGETEERANELLELILDTPIRGINGIMQATAEKITNHQIDSDGSLVKKEEYIITTAGTNLYNVMLHNAIDSTSVISNSIGDTTKIYGIEAGRMKIISETSTLIGKDSLNMRHLYLYADEMTRTGHVTSVERGGLSSREYNNILLRMAYGSPISVVTDATLASSKSRIYGIAAPQVLGGVPQIGTLYNSLIMNEDFISENLESVNSVLDGL